MPVTRSASRSATIPVEPPILAQPSTPAPNKRKRKTSSTATATVVKTVANGSDGKNPKKPRVNSKKQAGKDSESLPAFVAPTPVLKRVKSVDDTVQTFVPAVLSFSFEDAKRHLVSVDGRFEDLFAKLQCKPFEHLERVHPFRALTQSILGQQISWLAARSINYKFVRLFDPSLPEIPVDYSIVKSSTAFFPTPAQVAAQDIATLKTAGLSTRKAEYIQDLAARFADGRLSTEKLLEADDDELAEMLIEVRGIGRWTVDMFAIFTLRRPNILPIGDLGVQRGLLRWVLSLHSPAHPFSVSSDKTSLDERDDQTKAKADEKDELPTFNANGQKEEDVTGTLAPSSILPAPTSATPLASASNLPVMPTPFTPSINKTLYDVKKAGTAVTPLPEGLSVASLKGRLDGKKVKGALLTPSEMEQLTEEWRPYRSLGVYFMWALQDVSKGGA